jgi:hypothetical protein
LLRELSDKLISLHRNQLFVVFQTWFIQTSTMFHSILKFPRMRILLG